MCLCSCVTRATKRDTGRSVTTPRRPARAGRSKLRFVGRTSGSTYNLVSLAPLVSGHIVEFRSTFEERLLDIPTAFYTKLLCAAHAPARATP